jgi:hypothetical protein
VEVELADGTRGNPGVLSAEVADFPGLRCKLPPAEGCVGGGLDQLAAKQYTFLY